MSTLSKAQIESAADSLRQAEKMCEPIPPLRLLFPQATERDAYAIQQEVTRRNLAEGRRLTGRKIGLTSLQVQAQLGVSQPDYGAIFADMIFGDEESLPYDRTLQAKAEAEVALVLKADLPRIDTTFVELINAVDYAIAAVEIVSSRIEDWNISLFDTVADNASSAMVVLGGSPVPLDRVDLKACQMVLRRGQEVVSQGSGAACMGHPLNAALWLARTLAGLGQPLRAGDLVMTGALGPMVPVHHADRLVAEISGLGNVTVQFADK